MRRIAMGLAMVLVLLVMAAGVALAANQIIRCAGQPCTATGTDDLVYERAGNGLNDTIYLKAGDDQVRAAGYTRDQDRIYGSSGYDLIYVDDGDTNDRIRGGRGNDKCYVDARREIVSGCSVVVDREGKRAPAALLGSAGVERGKRKRAVAIRRSGTLVIARYGSG